MSSAPKIDSEFVLSRQGECVSEGVVLGRETVVDGSHACEVLTVEFNPVKGSTFACGGCGNQLSALSHLSLPKFCRNCRRELRLCPEGFPRDYLSQAKQYG